MVSVQEAHLAIEENIQSMGTYKIPIDQISSDILAEDVFSPIDLPSFRQSSMDGYAISYEDYKESPEFRIVGEIAAGCTNVPHLQKGEAYRIFTGAPVPEGSTAVVMQEKTKVEKDILIVEDLQVQEGLNIRPKASQISKNTLAMSMGTPLTPAAVGFLASMGHKKISVYRRPKVTVLITGDELVLPGNEINNGQVYESNSFSLKAALNLMGIAEVNFVQLKDDLSHTIEAISNALRSSDLILGTGGISVGKYDFMGKAMEHIGAQTIFYKVAQKPGKPLFFGMKDNVPIFGLPGNPGSVLSCFFMYVFPAIKKMQNAQNIYLPKMQLPISKKIKKSNVVANFLKARINENVVEPLKGQESYIISSFAVANCLIYIPKEKEVVEEGEMVTVYLLPYN